MVWGRVLKKKKGCCFCMVRNGLCYVFVFPIMCLNQIRTTTKTLKISFSEIAGESHVDGKYAHKVYGFLQPLLTGNLSGALVS